MHPAPRYATSPVQLFAIHNPTVELRFQRIRSLTPPQKTERGNLVDKQFSQLPCSRRAELRMEAVAVAATAECSAAGFDDGNTSH